MDDRMHRIFSGGGGLAVLDIRKSAIIAGVSLSQQRHCRESMFNDPEQRLSTFADEDSLSLSYDPHGRVGGTANHQETRVPSVTPLASRCKLTAGSRKFP